MKTSRKATYSSVTRVLKLSFINGIEFFNIRMLEYKRPSNYHLGELQFEVL